MTELQREYDATGKITLDQVLAAAKKYVHPASSSMLLVGDRAKDRAGPQSPESGGDRGPRRRRQDSRRRNEVGPLFCGGGAFQPRLSMVCGAGACSPACRSVAYFPACFDLPRRLLVAALAAVVCSFARRGPNRCANVPSARRLGHPHRVRLCRRHLGSAEDRRPGNATHVGARRGAVSPLLTRRIATSRSAPTTMAISTSTSCLAGRRAGATDPPPDGRPRARLASRRQAGAVHVEPRVGPSALRSVLSGRRQTAACPRSCRCRTASSRRSRPTPSRSRTCRRRNRTGHGSAIAAAGRRTSGGSTSRHSRRRT